MVREVDITVVLNAHREGRHLHPSIQSALEAIEQVEKAGLSAELLVVLDSPDESTLAYCDEFLPPCARAVTVNLLDLGLARNVGVESAFGRCIAFLDGDDLWGSTWLIAAHRFLTNRQERELILHPSLVVYFEARHAVWNLMDQEDPKFSKALLLEYNPWHALSFAKRETYQRTPFRPSNLKGGFGYEDWLFNCDTMARGVIHKVVPGTIHCLREKTWRPSLLKETIGSKSIIGMSELFALPWQGRS